MLSKERVKNVIGLNFIAVCGEQNKLFVSLTSTERVFFCFIKRRLTNETLEVTIVPYTKQKYDEQRYTFRVALHTMDKLI